MIICPACKHENPDGAEICEYCSTTLPVISESKTRIQPPPPPILLHLQTRTPVELPPDLSVIHVGKPNEQNSPNIDVSVFPNTEFVSRLHADILVKGNSYYIKDVGSDNGTYVNNKRLSVGEEHPLHSGDRIALGKDFTVVFEFFSPSEAKPEPNPPDPPPVPDPPKPIPDPKPPKPISQ